MRSDNDRSIITILDQIKTLVLAVNSTLLDPLELSVQAPGIRSSETRLESSSSPAPLRCHGSLLLLTPHHPEGTPATSCENSSCRQHKILVCVYLLAIGSLEERYISNAGS
jgi:hypothetical protein